MSNSRSFKVTTRQHPTRQGADFCHHMQTGPGHGPKISDTLLTGILIKGTCKYERKKSHNNLIAKNKYLYFDQKPDPRLGIAMIRYVVFSKKFQNKDLLCNKIF